MVFAARWYMIRAPEIQPTEYSMGKGDIRTRRGKLFRGSFGNSRPKHKKSAASVAPARPAAPATPAKPVRESAPKRRS